MSYITMGLAVLFLGRIIQSEHRSNDVKMAVRELSELNHKSCDCGGMDTL